MKSTLNTLDYIKVKFLDVENKSKSKEGLLAFISRLLFCNVKQSIDPSTPVSIITSFRVYQLRVSNKKNHTVKYLKMVSRGT